MIKGTSTTVWAMRVIVITLGVLVALVYPAAARVSGECANCHTMHNSQNGTDVNGDGPYEALVSNSCVGCHTGTNNGSNTTPYVMSTVEPVLNVNTLAGGNFWWVENVNDNRGHNAWASNPENSITGAPLSYRSCGGGATSCHLNLSNAFSGVGAGAGWNGRQGCTKCHMLAHDYGGPKGFHHKDDTGLIIDTEDEGWYRFLAAHSSGGGGRHGVKGIEDHDWQYTRGAGDHNEYYGYEGDRDEVQDTGNLGFRTLGHAMTAYCVGCHPYAHMEISSTSGSWIRHPSDAVIPNTGEYATAFGAAGGTGTYNPAVPVARANLTAVLDTVILASDMVMCLSCHVAHGSPYPDMLRWDYEATVADGGGSGGCFTCHTGKN